MSSDDVHAVRTALLTRCPACASGLVQPAEVAQDADRVLVRRRCPECGHTDLVEADPDLLHAWLRREARIRAELSRTADRIARSPRIELSP
jgi:uncharacterized radical SAM superfamily Fe-S cluster-containing enzyme